MQKGWVKSAYVDLAPVTQQDTDADSEAEQEEFVPESILGHRDPARGEREFHVAWEGWEGANTWEPLSNLGADHPLVVEYLKNI
jgi:hypothetical protein